MPLVPGFLKLVKVSSPIDFETSDEVKYCFVRAQCSLLAATSKDHEEANKEVEAVKIDPNRVAKRVEVGACLCSVQDCLSIVESESTCEAKTAPEPDIEQAA